MKVVWLGKGQDYREIHQLQERLVAVRSAGLIDDVLLMLEHDSVYTVGRHRGAAANLLAVGDTPVVEVERGGDVTWHGPGQLVAYPIIQLEGSRRDLRRHLRDLEQGVIELLAEFELAGVRDERNTGVWLAGDSFPQKVASMGVAVRRWVTWHGLALNVNPIMSAFSRINPCGMSSSVMTCIADHLQNHPSPQDLLMPLAGHLARQFDLTLDPRLYTMADLNRWLDAEVG